MFPNAAALASSPLAASAQCYQHPTSPSSSASPSPAAALAGDFAPPASIVGSIVHVKHASNVTISDEENTSEYSHAPSSQRSTLESNPELPSAIKHHRIKQQQPMHKSTTSAKDTDDDDDDDDVDDDEDEIGVDSTNNDSCDSSSDEDNERVGQGKKCRRAANKDVENGNSY